MYLTHSICKEITVLLNSCPKSQQDVKYFISLCDETSSVICNLKGFAENGTKPPRQLGKYKMIQNSNLVL